MGDRICVTVTRDGNRSPTLYCHWAGQRALIALHKVLEVSRHDISNVFCNLIVEVMERECHDCSYYIYNDGEAEGMADWDNWSWTYDLKRMTWTTTDPRFEGRELTPEEVEDLVRRCRKDLVEGGYL